MNIAVQYQGVVAADGKSVQLTAGLVEAQAGDPQRARSALLPDGGALLLDATEELKPGRTPRLARRTPAYSAVSATCLPCSPAIPRAHGRPRACCWLRLEW